MIFMQSHKLYGAGYSATCSAIYMCVAAVIKLWKKQTYETKKPKLRNAAIMLLSFWKIATLCKRFVYFRTSADFIVTTNATSCGLIYRILPLLEAERQHVNHGSLYSTNRKVRTPATEGEFSCDDIAGLGVWRRNLKYYCIRGVNYAVRLLSGTRSVC